MYGLALTTYTLSNTFSYAVVKNGKKYHCPPSSSVSAKRKKRSKTNVAEVCNSTRSVRDGTHNSNSISTTTSANGNATPSNGNSISARSNLRETEVEKLQRMLAEKSEQVGLYKGKLSALKQSHEELT